MKLDFGIKTVAAAAVLAAAVLGPQTALAGAQDFTLINKTGYEIGQVFVSPTRTTDWEEDVLGRDTLPEGSSVDIAFDRGTDACHWDMKVVYTIDNTSAEWSDFNLCEVSKVTIFYNANTDTTTATYE